MTRSAQCHSDICTLFLYKSGPIGHFRRRRAGNRHAIQITALIQGAILVFGRHVEPESAVSALPSAPSSRRSRDASIRTPHCGPPSCLARRKEPAWLCTSDDELAEGCPTVVLAHFPGMSAGTADQLRAKRSGASHGGAEGRSSPEMCGE